MIGSSPPVPSASALTVRVDLRQVGHEMDSETKHLQGYEDDTTQLLVFDTPGFGDTEGTTTDIANSIAISSMIRECQSVRFVILVEAESLRTGRGVLLRGLFDLLARFLKDAENYSDSLLFLFTKTELVPTWRKLEQHLKDCAKAVHFKDAAPLLDHVLGLVQKHKQLLLLKPERMKLPDPDDVAVSSCLEDVWGLISGLVPITDISNAVRFPLNASSSNDLVIACQQLGESVQGRLAGRFDMTTDDLDGNLDDLRVLAASMHTEDVSRLYTRVVKSLGDCVSENLGSAEDGLKQQRFSKVSEGLLDTLSLDSILKQHDSGAAVECSNRMQALKKEINNLVRAAGACVSLPEVSCNELREALDRLQGIECNLKSFLTEENCTAYLLAVAAVRERFDGKYVAVGTVLSGLERGEVEDEGADGFSEILDELQQFCHLQQHVPWTHCDCYGIFVGRISIAVNVFSVQFLTKLQVAESSGVDDFAGNCRGLVRALSVLRFADGLDNSHCNDAKGNLGECNSALESFIDGLVHGIDKGVRDNDFEVVAVSLGKLLLISSTLEPGVVFTARCASKRAWIVETLDRLASTISKDLDGFTTKPWEAGRYTAFSDTVAILRRATSCLSFLMAFEMNSFCDDLSKQWDRVVALQIATVEAAERALPQPRLHSDQSAGSIEDPGELLVNMARLQVFREKKNSVGVPECRVDSLCNEFVGKLILSFEEKGRETLVGTEGCNPGVIMQDLECLRKYSTAFRESIRCGVTFTILMDDAVGGDGGGSSLNSVPEHELGSVQIAGFEKLVLTVESAFAEAVVKLQERAVSLELEATQKVVDAAFSEASALLDLLSSLRDELDGYLDAGGFFGKAYDASLGALKERARAEAAAFELDVKCDKMQSAQERLERVGSCRAAHGHFEEIEHMFERLSGVLQAKTSKFNAEVHALLAEGKWRPLSQLLEGHLQLVDSTPEAGSQFSQAKQVLIDDFLHSRDVGLGIVQNLSPARALTDERLRKLAQALNKFAAAVPVFAVFGEEESENEFLQMSSELSQKFLGKVSQINERAGQCVRKLDFRGFEAASQYLVSFQEEIRVCAGDIGEQISGLDDAMGRRLKELPSALQEWCVKHDFREIDKIFTSFDRGSEVEVLAGKCLEDERLVLEKVLEGFAQRLCAEIESLLNQEEIKGVHSKIEDFRKLLCSETVQATRFNREKLQQFEKSMDCMKEEIFSVRALKADPKRIRDSLIGFKEIDHRFYKSKCYQFLDTLQREQVELLSQVETGNEGAVKRLSQNLADLDLFEVVLEGHEEVIGHKQQAFDVLMETMDKVHRLLQKQIRRGEWDEVPKHWPFFLAGCELLRAGAFLGQSEKQQTLIEKFTDVEKRLGLMHESLEKTRRLVNTLSLRSPIVVEDLERHLRFLFQHSHFHQSQFENASEASGQELSFDSVVKKCVSLVRKSAEEEVPLLWEEGGHDSIKTILNNLESLSAVNALRCDAEQARLHVCAFLTRVLDEAADRAGAAFSLVAAVAFGPLQEDSAEQMKNAKDCFAELQQLQLLYVTCKDVTRTDRGGRVLEKAMQDSTRRVQEFSGSPSVQPRTIAILVMGLWALPCEIDNAKFFDSACSNIKGVFQSLTRARFNFDLLAFELTDCGAMGGEIVAHFKEFAMFQRSRFKEATSRMTPKDSLKMLAKSNTIPAENTQSLDIAVGEYRASWEFVLGGNFRDVASIAVEVRAMVGQRRSIGTIIGGIFGVWSKLLGPQPGGEWERPHPVQVLSIFRLLGVRGQQSWTSTLSRWVAGGLPGNSKGHVIELKTGEGKSLVLGVVAAFLGLERCRVDVVCFSKHLSGRDAEAFSPLFEALGVQEQIVYGTFDSLADNLINAGGNVRELTDQLLYSDMASALTTSVGAHTGGKKILLLDEMDVIFSDDFYGNFNMPTTQLVNKHVEGIQRYVWANRSTPASDLKVKVQRLEAYKSLTKEFSRSTLLIDAHINDMLRDLQLVDTHQYLIKDGDIAYQLADLSIASHLTFGYQSLFAAFLEAGRGAVSEAALKSRFGFSICCGQFSYAEISSGYDRVLGVTGTLQSLGPYEKRVIGDKFQIREQTLAPSIYGVSNLMFRKGVDVHVESGATLQHRKIR